MSSFLKLSRPALSGLARAIETGRLNFPVSVVSISSYVPSASLPEIVPELNQLHQQGMKANHIARMLRLLIAERAASQNKEDQIALVWTGPEILGTESRDTQIVVREMFSNAQRSVLISSFAIDQGKKGHEVFLPLAECMDTRPELQVRMFLNVKRNWTDPTTSSMLLRQYAENFRSKIWPGKRLPSVFYDVRSLETTSHSNACLHAKCVVVDEEQVLVTSANFTQAAHRRNIEAGILVTDRVIARAIRSQFEMLVTHRIIQRVPGL